MIQRELLITFKWTSCSWWWSHHFTGSLLDNLLREFRVRIIAKARNPWSLRWADCYDGTCPHFYRRNSGKTANEDFRLSHCTDDTAPQCSGLFTLVSVSWTNQQVGCPSAWKRTEILWMKSWRGRDPPVTTSPLPRPGEGRRKKRTFCLSSSSDRRGFSWSELAEPAEVYPSEQSDQNCRK